MIDATLYVRDAAGDSNLAMTTFKWLSRKMVEPSGVEIADLVNPMHTVFGGYVRKVLTPH